VVEVTVVVVWPARVVVDVVPATVVVVVLVALVVVVLGSSVIRRSSMFAPPKLSRSTVPVPGTPGICPVFEYCQSVQPLPP
jgi:hypothetical protein